MTQYEVTIQYETGLTEPAVEEFITSMTGVDSDQVEIREVDGDE